MNTKNTTYEKLILLDDKYLVTAQTKIAFNALQYQMEKIKIRFTYQDNPMIANRLNLRGKVITIKHPLDIEIKNTFLHLWLTKNMYKYGFCFYPSYNKSLNLIFTGLKMSTYIHHNYHNDYKYYLEKEAKKASSNHTLNLI